ncbi:hypothetical protein [Streptomyces sp. NPDC059015]|uniref:hypothetical protein n=1 Tax=unclassified Streptomyces TaxID=2593676 RepID=UPI0036C79A6E
MSRVSPTPSAQPAREELCAYADRYGYTEHVNALLDAFRDEVLREAAEKQRKFVLSEDFVCDDWEAALDVANLIDPPAAEAVTK